MQKQGRWMVWVVLYVLIFTYPSTPRANVLGVSYQNFFPTPAQTDYITVHSTESIRAKKWRMNFYGTLSGNQLFYFEAPRELQHPVALKDQLMAASWGIAYGVTSRLEYGLSLPLHLNHRVTPKEAGIQLTQQKITMIHNQFKYVFRRRGSGDEDQTGTGVVLSLDIPNTKEDAFLGQKQIPIATIEFVYDQGDERESFSANAGYRWRSPGAPYDAGPVLPMEDQILFSLAYQHQLPGSPSTHWIMEFYGATPIEKSAYKDPKLVSSAEALLALRTQPSKSTQWSLGLGTEVMKGTLSPDWRVFVGGSWDFTWAKKEKGGPDDAILEHRKLHGPADEITDPMKPADAQPYLEDEDRDGIIDDDDMCPRTPRGVRVDREGCPSDQDEDGIPDFEDQCPETPREEVVNSRGCPALK